MNKNFLGMNKNFLGMNKYLLGIFIVIIIAIIVTVTVISVNESKKKKKEKVKLVFYTGKGCPSCRKLIPDLKKFKKWTRNRDKYKAVNIKCENNPNECRKQKIKRVPTLKLFVNGKEKTKRIGCCSCYTLKELIKSYKDYK